MAEASDFKFDTHHGFAKVHRKIPHRRKSGRGPGLDEFSKSLGFPYNISATTETIDFKFGMQLGLAKAHHKTTPRGKSARDFGLGKLPNIL